VELNTTLVEQVSGTVNILAVQLGEADLIARDGEFVAGEHTRRPRWYRRGLPWCCSRLYQSTHRDKLSDSDWCGEVETPIS
jgi:hypothetical protein